MNDCDHVFSPLCLRRHIHEQCRKETATRATIMCPVSGCEKQIAACDLLNFLSVAQHNILLQRELRDMIDSSGGRYITCPKCSSPFERLDPQVDAKNSLVRQYEVNGKLLSLAHFGHYHSFRFRCPACSIEFCSKCFTIPYHMSSTCEEFESRSEKKSCRFCNRPALEDSNKSTSDPLKSPVKKKPMTCGMLDCQQNQAFACAKHLACGHPCPGIMDESECPPCLVDNCLRSTMGKVGTSWCSICYIEELRAAPCIVLKCGHIFHFKCVKKQLLQKWPGARISFGFMSCPECNQEIAHTSLTELFNELITFRAEVRNGALLRLRHEGLDKDDAVVNLSGPYYKNPASYAEATLSYYQCYVCERPYFGGIRRCDDNIDEEQGRFNPSELVCAVCVPLRQLKTCRTHGSEFIEYKCKFCCSVAQWFCWGTTHFCSSCHRMQERGDFVTKKKITDLPSCQGKKNCPLRVDHPPNGTEEFALGCAMCRMSCSSNF